MQKWKMYSFLKRTLTKFMKNKNLEWDELLLFSCYCYNMFPGSNGTECPFFLMLGWDLAEGCLSNLNNRNKYYGTNEGKMVLEELLKLWKHHTNLLKEMHQRNKHTDNQHSNNNPKSEIGKLVMVTNHACQTLEPKYLLDYRVLKYLTIAPSC